MNAMTIQLSRGLFATVNAEDFDRLSRHKWSALKSGSGPIYAARKITVSKNNRKVILMHRVIANAMQGQKVDHRNGNGLDNRRDNLRICTDQENMQGFKTARKNKTSQYRGVHFRVKSRRWIAQISVDKKVKHLGCFPTEEEAAKAYDEAAARYFGEFAHLNDVLNRGGRGVISPLDRI